MFGVKLRIKLCLRSCRMVGIGERLVPNLSLRLPLELLNCDGKTTHSSIRHWT